LDELFGKLVQDGRGLMEIFSRPPVSPGEPVIRIRSRLKNLRDEKLEIDALWEEAWQGRHSDLIGQTDQPGSATPSTHVEREQVSTMSLSSGNASPKNTKPPLKSGEVDGDRGVVRKVSHGSSSGGLNRRNSDKFSELEEEAYEVRG